MYRINRFFVSIWLLLFALQGMGCNQRTPDKVPDRGVQPLKAVERLLSLHDLNGRQPEERSAESRNREVDRGKLEALVSDLNKHDPFTSNLYVGFIVGALARYQTRLMVTQSGDRAEIMAGKARVVMRRADNEWRFVLDESIPEVIQQRAAEEKRRFESARAMSAALSL